MVAAGSGMNVMMRVGRAHAFLLGLEARAHRIGAGHQAQRGVRARAEIALAARRRRRDTGRCKRPPGWPSAPPACPGSCRCRSATSRRRTGRSCRRCRSRRPCRPCRPRRSCRRLQPPPPPVTGVPPVPDAPPTPPELPPALPLLPPVCLCAAGAGRRGRSARAAAGRRAARARAGRAPRWRGCRRSRCPIRRRRRIRLPPAHPTTSDKHEAKQRIVEDRSAVRFDFMNISVAGAVRAGQKCSNWVATEPPARLRPRTDCARACGSLTLDARARGPRVARVDLDRCA